MNRCALLTLIVLLCPGMVWGRTWTSREGKEIEADFVDATEEAVTLNRNDGKQVTFKLERLCDGDQQFIRTILARRGSKKATLTESSPTTSPPAEKLTPARIPKFGASKKSDEDSDEDDGAGEDDSDSEGSPFRDSGDTTKKKPKIENRTWVDAFGRKSGGKFVRFQGNNVIILRGGRQATLNYWELSEADQSYLKELCVAFGQSQLIPKINPATVAGSPAANPMAGASMPGFPNAGIPNPGNPAARMPNPAMPAIPPTSNPEELARRLRELENGTRGPATTYLPPASPAGPAGPAGGYTPPMTTYNPPVASATSPTYMPSMPATPSYTPPAMSMPPTQPYIPSSAMPSSTMPGMPSFSSPTMQKQCESCGKVLSANFTAGDRCPGCGVYFSVDRTTGKTASGGGFGGGNNVVLFRTIGVLAVVAIKIVAFCAWRSQQ